MAMGEHSVKKQEAIDVVKPFTHPAEAFHGDLGMIQPSDVVVLISTTGETDEILKLIPSLQNFGNKIVAITGNTRSSLLKNSDVILNVKVEREICPNNLAPTSFTTATLVMGDALAVGLIHLRDFKPVTAQNMMTIIPITISQEQRLIEAEHLMRENHIKSVIVVDAVNRPKVVGVLEYFQ